MTEIRRRAEIRTGELSRELDKAKSHGGEIWLPTAGKSKSEALADAGISTSTAHEYEQLTGGADARGEAAAKRAIEETLARGRKCLLRDLRISVRQPSREIVAVALSGVQNSRSPARLGDQLGQHLAQLVVA